MAAPVVTAVPVGAYTKVATGVTAIHVVPLDSNQYFWTYRLTAAGAPTLLNEASQLPPANTYTGITLAASSDVYVWNVGPIAGNVRVDS